MERIVYVSKKFTLGFCACGCKTETPSLRTKNKKLQRFRHGHNSYTSGERNRNENHFRWKGDDVKYRSLHKWVRKHLPEPDFCEICKVKPSLDLANKTGIYNRELVNWIYLCRSCHIKQDGRLYRNLKQYRYQLSDP